MDLIGSLNVANKFIGAPFGVGVYNVGLSLSAGRLKIVQADGTDFGTSPEDKGYVIMPHATLTSGNNVKLDITTANNYFDDASATSDIIGEEFDTTAGTAWGNGRPFFLYACNGDNTGDTNSTGLKFFISPDPTLTKTSSSSNDLGYHGNPASTASDSSCFFLTSTDVTSTHTSKPCILIGSVAMTKDASDDWTVDALGENYGIGIYPWHVMFVMPAAQMGAGAGKYTTGNGPSWSSTIYRYKLGLNGQVSLLMKMSGTCTNGSDSNSCAFAAPYVSQQITANLNSHGHAPLEINNVYYGGLAAIAHNSSTFSPVVNVSGVITTVANNSWAQSDDFIDATLSYQAFSVG